MRFKLIKMVEYLIFTLKAVIIPLYPYNYKKDTIKAGKVPMIAKWSELTETTRDMLETWKKEFPKCNFGMLTGSPSGIVAIDIDGEGGETLLEEMSGGDVPDTVEYITPGGGRRLLYKIPDEHKDKTFSLYKETGNEPHTECALLGDGRQTVLPYSRHPNGGSYMFVEGKDFFKTELALAPQWMIDKMLTAPPEQLAEKKESKKCLDANIRMIKKICEKCKKLHSKLADQINGNLYEYELMAPISLLYKTQGKTMALTFAQASPDERLVAKGEAIVEKLESDSGKGVVRCTTMGCQEAEIKKCQVYFEEINGDIKNTPALHLGTGAIRNQFFGFYYNDKGRFSGMKGDVFARRVHERYPFRKQLGCYYIYDDNYWKIISKSDMQALVYHYFQEFEPDRWDLETETKSYWANIERQTKELGEPSRNYINFKNTLLNLDTFKCEPHNHNITTTTKLPINYQIKAKCPKFKKFMLDIFQGDKDLVKLMLEIMGYCLSYSTKAEKIFILLGDGSNGKSVLIALLIALAGKNNTAAIPLSKFNQRFALSQIVGKTLNVCSETDSSRKFDTEVIKAISSGDTVNIEFKGKDIFVYNPFTKLMFSANRLPFTDDRTHGLERRLVIIPFNKRYMTNPDPENPLEGLMNKNLLDELMEEIDGIAALVIKALRRLKNNDFNFTKSEAAENALKEYILTTNLYLDFCEQCVSKGTGTDRLYTEDFLDHFKEWCYNQGHTRAVNITMRTFLKEIRSNLKNLKLPCETKASNKKYYFPELVLNHENKQTDINRKATKRVREDVEDISADVLDGID